MAWYRRFSLQLFLRGLSRGPLTEVDLPDEILFTSTQKKEPYKRPWIYMQALDLEINDVAGFGHGQP